MQNNNVFKLKHSILIYIMVFFSSLVIFQYNGRSWFLYLQIIFCIVMALSTKKVVLLPYPIINLIFLELILSAFSGLISNMADSYKKAAVVMALFMVPMYFVASYCYILIKKNSGFLTVIVKAFKAMCLLHMVWIPFQYIMYHIVGVDINNLIFVETLHIIEKATFIRSWVYFPSGITYHSAVLAPLFVISLFLFKSLPVRLLIIVDSVICGNSTSTVGVFFAVILMFVFWLMDRHKNKPIRIKFKTIIIAVLLFIIFIYLFHQFEMKNTLGDRIQYLWQRLFGDETDESTLAHFQYFSDYFSILKSSSLFQILFGCGEGCSGYYISLFYNRYISLGNWSIECDIVNILVNRGIIGFLLYYGFLFYIMFKGWKKDRRYFIVMSAILIEGFGYNVQWDYTLFMELIFYFTLKLDINFFEIDTDLTSDVVSDNKKESFLKQKVGM